MKMPAFFLIAFCTTLLAAGQPPATPEYEGIRAYLVAHPQIKTIEQLFEKLPDGFFSRSAVAFRSDSSQKAKDDSPRAIVFSDDARSVMAFNSGPPMGGGRTLEFISWNDNTKSFDFREIVFPEKLTDKLDYSEVNPTKCKDCHERQGALRPIWDPYNHWPNFFNERNGLASEREEKALVAYAKRLGENAGRFSKLHRENSSFSLGERIRFTKEYLANDRKYGPNVFDASNQRLLNKTLQYWNFQRVVANWRNKPWYSKLKYAIAASLACQTPLENLIPPSTSDQLKKNGKDPLSVALDSEGEMRQASVDMAKRLRQPELIKETPEGPTYSAMFQKGSQFTLQRLRYILNIEGVEIRELFLNRRGYISFTDKDPWTIDRYLLATVLEDILPEVPGLKDRFEWDRRKLGTTELVGALPKDDEKEVKDPKSDYNAACAELQKRSLAAFRPPPTPRRSGLQLREHLDSGH